MSDSFGKNKSLLEELAFGDFKIKITPGEYINMVVISSDKDLTKFGNTINAMISDVEEMNREQLLN